MGYLNRKKSKAPPQASHLNWMAGKSFEITDPFVRLRLAASSCFFGEPMYYHRDKKDARPIRHQPASRLTDDEVAYLRSILNAIDPQDWRQLTPAQLLENSIDAALAADPEKTLQEAARLRQEEHMRTTPQVILVRAAHHPQAKGTGLVRRFAPEIIRRADEPAVSLAYQLAAFGKPIPSSLKRAWREVIQTFDDYQLAKYRLEGHQVKTADVVKLVHPKSESVHKLMTDQLRTTDLTWESIVSEMGSNAEGWRTALKKMGHMALLRNLRNLLKVGIQPDEFLPELIAGAKKGQQLPFRYYSAYRSLGSDAPQAVKTAVEQCMMLSLGNLPHFTGRVMSLCDNSGSARGTATSSMGSMQIATIGNLTGLLTGMRANQGYVGVFGDRLETQPVRTGSIFEQLDEVEKIGQGVGGSTENGIWLFWDAAIRNKEHWDTIFIYSDMQAGHGGLYGVNTAEYADYRWKNQRNIDVPKLISVYRQKVNPAVRVFLVQIAGYQDTIVPEFYDHTYILGGWGEGLLRFAAEMMKET